ncbi:hypothetical protein [Tissierella sp. Yu-01]|uniref:hypothetical protein n=1 Tax=Tissierella sp. Yu-01 TaxID=3035694 RepID=UPI00240CE587|nr:hypothetical protein [Tissierella sp. Yu-01]WFA09298.1 hypothetical protein P3962_01615 [Tissierella sp. Yu-01]
MIKAIDFQWNKIWFLRSARIYLLIAFITSIFIGAIFSITTDITQDRGLKDLTAAEIIEINLLSIDVATIFLLIFVSLEIGKEFQNKSIQTYVSVIPNRRRYFFSKLLTYLGISIVLGIIVGMISLGNGYLIIKIMNKPFPSIYGVMRFFFGCILMPITYVVFATSAAFFFRSTSGGIVFPVLIMFLPSFIKIFPSFIQEAFVPIIPASAIHSIAGVAQIGGMEDIGIILALFTLSIWYIIGCFISIKTIERIDI